MQGRIAVGLCTLLMLPAATAGWTTGQDQVSSGEAERIRLHALEDGGFVATWVDDDEDSPDLWANNYTPAGGWSTPQEIEPENLGGALPADLYPVADGTMALWRQFDGDGSNIWANTLTADGWVGATKVAPNDAGPASGPVLRTLGDVSVAVWRSGGFDGSELWTSTYTPWAGWGLAAPLSEGEGIIGEVEVQVVGDRIIAVWEQGDGERADIWAASRMDDSGWTAPVNIEDAADSADMAAMQRVGPQLVAVWRQEAAAGWQFWANAHDPTDGWGTPVRIEQGGVSTLAQAWTHAAGGEMVATWLDTEEHGTDLWVNTYSPDDGWGTAHKLEDRDEGPARRPHIAASGGDIFVVWRQEDATTSDIWARRYTPGEGWGTAERIEQEPGRAVRPKVQPLPAGLLVVWEQDSEEVQDLWANTYDPVSGWGTPQVIDVEDHADPDDVELHATDQAVVVVWNQHDGQRENMWADVYVAGEGWTGAQQIEADDGLDDSFEVQFHDLPDGVLVAWLQEDGTRLNLLSNTWSRTDGWGEAEPVEGGGTGVDEFQLMGDPWGNGMLVWEQTLARGRLFVAEQDPVPLQISSPQEGPTNVQPLTVAGTTREDAQVTVDGVEVEVGADGGFSVPWDAAPGDHTIEVAAALPYDAGRTVQRIDVTIDRIAPELHVDAPPNATTEGAVVVTGTTEPGAQVTVDGQQASVAPDGTWNATAPLEIGPNPITVEAQDAAGNTAEASVEVVRKAAPGEGSPWPTAGIAVVLAGAAWLGRRAHR